MRKLETARLLLEPLTVEHAVSLWPYIQYPGLYQYIPRDPPVNLQALSDRFKKLEARVSPDGSETWLNWAVQLKDTPIYIGKIEATIVKDNLAYIAYELDPLQQGKGYATEACHAMIVELQELYDVKIIQAYIDTRNTKSIKLVERLGLKLIKTIKDADFFKGEKSDEYVYELKTSI